MGKLWKRREEDWDQALVDAGDPMDIVVKGALNWHR